MAKLNSTILEAPDILLAVLDKLLPDENLRLIKLIYLVAENQSKFTAEEIGEKLNVSVTTIYRDFARLNKLGIFISSRKRLVLIWNFESIKKSNNSKNHLYRMVEICRASAA